VEEQLSRVPFTREEEQTISSMARWMRFMAVVGIVGGILMLFFLVLGVGLLAAVQDLGQSSSKWAEVKQLVEQSGPIFYLMVAVFLLAAIITLWQNFALYHAGDFFNLVARTDVADVDYLAQGLDKLRIFFKIQVLVVIVTVAVAFGTAFTMWAVLSHAQ
jgi:hypothetical protein